MKLGIFGDTMAAGKSVRAAIEAAVEKTGATYIITAATEPGVAREARHFALNYPPPGMALVLFSSPQLPPAEKLPGEAMAAAQYRKYPRHRLYKNARWKTTSENYLTANPACAICDAAATDTDHIIPHSGDAGLFNAPENYQPLCRSCHGVKTRREARAMLVIGEADSVLVIALAAGGEPGTRMDATMASAAGKLVEHVAVEACPLDDFANTDASEWINVDCY